MAVGVHPGRHERMHVHHPAVLADLYPKASTQTNG
jgi:hypothetical protein